MIDINKTFVTSDHHFREWTRFYGLLCENSKEQEEEHIAKWNSVVGKDDLVLYVGDFCDGRIADLDEICKRLNGRIVLIKGNHEWLDDSIYRMAFADVVDRMYIDELKLVLVHIPETASLRPGERMIYGHHHRGRVEPPSTTRDSICVCAKWHEWKPITLAEAIRQMNAAAAPRTSCIAPLLRTHETPSV
jgi:calcineurin-like phosphoesterase family protein